jgi:uncharacterized membrane protein YeaQ/YmgE (transglycosylase-associated protein family)
MYAIIQDVSNQPVSFTVNTTLGQILTWVVIGLIAGVLANLLVRGHGRGCLTSIVLGLIGAVVGGFLFSILGIRIFGSLNLNFTLAWADVIAAFVGALIVLLLFRLLFRGYWY